MNNKSIGTESTASSMANAKLKLLACQIAVPETTSQQQRDQHLQHCANWVEEQLQHQTVDLVVLPELSSIDYSPECFEKLDVLAETERGASFECWSKLARDYQCTVVYGFARRVLDGFRISTAVVSSYGDLMGIYDKIHLAQFGDSMEKEYFSTAGRQLLVFSVAGFRIAPIICYDIRFPELCRELTLRHHVDLILHVGAYARDDSFYSWHAFATTRAVENQCFLLSLNRAGKHFGRSVFCGPWVDQNNPPTVFSDDEQVCYQLELDRSKLIKTRATFTFLEDRLDDYKLPIEQI